jgi:thioredoxin reductase (NADPH)
MTNAVILIVDDDPHVLAALRRDIRARYREEYRILAAGSGEAALGTIQELKARGDSLAMVISDQRMPGMLGVDLLAKSRDVYPLARRVLITAYSDIGAAIRAINEVHLDHYFEKPWDPPEERLYPGVDELLGAWHAEYTPEVTGLRLIGHQWSARSHAVKDFLASNLVPYRWFEVGRDHDAGRLMEASHVVMNELPALFLEDGTVLRNPEIRQIAESLGLGKAAAHDLYDLIIVGAGPAGLAAAVYGASEGLRTLLLDGHGPGGQAGSSSRIENYLGFPTGVSGSELTRRAVAQAHRLGAEFLAPVAVTGVSVNGGYKHLAFGDGRKLVSRAVIAATGMTYRELPAEGIAAYTGAGVYYGSATTEGNALRDRRIVVVGGGNSAGQSAIYLSRYASDVQVVVRADSLSKTMSQYLIEQLGQIPNVRVQLRTAVARVEGDGHLERVWLKSLDDGASVAQDVDALFVFIGARPHSEWLPPEVLCDAKGFVLTGRDMRLREEFARIWKETREPLPLETSVAGLFAAGDVRAGAMNRVASAVGEGAMAVRLVHDYLAHT